jgi:uncharacterized protein
LTLIRVAIILGQHSDEEEELRMSQIHDPKQPASDEAEALELLKKAKTVAVVGISAKEERDSHRVAKYLKEHGYRIIPVNPGLKEVLGEPCYPDLKTVPEHIDVVDIFRSIDAISGIVDEAIAAGADSVWMQLGLFHEEAAEKARKAGLSVVMNRCMKIDHARL